MWEGRCEGQCGMGGDDIRGRSVGDGIVLAIFGDLGKVISAS